VKEDPEKMTTQRWRGVLLLIGIPLLAGCGLSDPVLLSEDPDLRKIREERAHPIGWSVRVGKVDLPKSEEGGNGKWTLSLDADRVRNDVARALEETSIFREVRADEGQNPVPADLLLKLRITRATGRFVGTNGYATIQTLLWWSLSSILACLVADEQYSASLELQAELEEVVSGEAIWSGTMGVEFEAALDHYQKGLDIWDLIPPGTFLATHDPDKVTEALAPHLVRKVQVALARRLSGEVPPPTVDVCVLVCGEERTGRPGGDGKSGVEGRLAKAFEAHRTRAQVIRLDEKTTPAALLETLSRLAGGEDIRIGEFALYFHGKGSRVSRARGRASLPALAFPRGKGKAGRLLLADLLKAVEAIPAGRRSLVIDAGFRGGDRFQAPDPRDRRSGRVEIPRSGKVGMLLAGLEAFTHEESGTGLLTHHLLKALASPVDANKDGTLTLTELHGQIAWAVARAARRAGGEGAPLVAGDGGLFRLPKKTGETPGKGGKDE
jgi:hypothetical protein